MSILHALVLGAVQGLTEFLPVSSSGHLQLVPWLLGWTELTSRPQLHRTFDVALHMGTLAGALAYFWRDLWRLARADRRTGLLLLLSVVPAAVVGAVADEAVAETPEVVIAAMLIVFGAVLLWADRLRGERSQTDFTLRDALLMGGGQALALVPGVSRSGATISAARALGFDRESATRLSFLMSLPVIGGAGVYKGADVISSGIPGPYIAAFVWGMVASAVTGFLAVWLLLRYLRTRSFLPFVVYRVAVGVGVIGLVVTGLR